MFLYNKGAIMLRRLFIVIVLLGCFAPLALGQEALVYKWIKFLPADPQRGGFVKDMFPLGEEFAVVVHGNFAGRPIFKVNQEGKISSQVLPNEAPAQSLAVSSKSIMLCNNIYLLNLTSTISLYSHNFTKIKEIPTPFTDSEAVLITPPDKPPYFVVAGQRLDGSFELWGISNNGEVIWQKKILGPKLYSNNFGIYWHEGRIILVAQHVTQGLTVLQYSVKGDLVKETLTPALGPHISFAKNTITVLWHGSHMVVGAVVDERVLRICFVNIATGAQQYKDLPFTEGSEEHLRLAALNETTVGLGIGDTLYVADYAGTFISKITNPLPKAFIVCFTALPDGDVLVGGSYQMDSMWAPYPFVARFPKSVVFSPATAPVQAK